MNPSEVLEKQGNSAVNRRWQRNGDEELGLAQMGADGCRWVQMVGHGTKFGRKKEQAIAALLSHRSIEEAARAAGIGVNTLLRWMKDPEFDKAYRKARRTAFGQGTARLQQASGVAVSTVLKIMLDQHAPASTKLRAADMVLTHGAKAIEIEDVEARVSELERVNEESKTR
jgi:transposase-like protein